jgi:hypothetical protein
MNTTAAHVPATNYQRHALRGILLGGFFAGLIDWIYPTVKTVMGGGSWMRPWKGVASGLIGPTAHEGGLGIVALGTFLHFGICIAAAAILYFVVSRLKWLPRQWLLLAVIHGLAVMLTMNYVILPLSAIGRGIYPLETLHVTAFMHILIVGVPTGFFVARALRQAGR